MKDRSHDAAMAEVFRNDPAYAAELLNSILEDGEQAELLIALRQMAEAFGGVRGVARAVELNPAVGRLAAISCGKGLRLTVQPLATH